MLDAVKCCVVWVYKEFEVDSSENIYGDLGLFESCDEEGSLFFRKIGG